MLAKPSERSLICSSLIGIDQIPIDILHLGNGGDDLRFESQVGDLSVALGDADIALVGGEAEARQKRLRDVTAKLGIQLGIDGVVGVLLASRSPW